MKRKHSHVVYKRFAQAVISALLGQAKLSTTLFVYAVLALLLLGYVSAQVYASVLTQEIGELKQQENWCRETVNKMTSEYVSLSSRARVTSYCETVLGMTRANDGDLERFAVKGGLEQVTAPLEFTRLRTRRGDQNSRRPALQVGIVGERK